MMLDQYGHPVPDDLVVLPEPRHLLMGDVDIIMAADWYKADGRVLLASASAIGFLSETDPSDADVDLDLCEVSRVDDCLKRWSDEDGFYHA